MESHEVLGLIKKGELKLVDCFTIIEDSIFKKIRNGQSTERSPSSRQSQRPRTINLQ